MVSPSVSLLKACDLLKNNPLNIESAALHRRLDLIENDTQQHSNIIHQKVNTVTDMIAANRSSLSDIISGRVHVVFPPKYESSKSLHMSRCTLKPIKDPKANNINNNNDNGMTSYTCNTHTTDTSPLPTQSNNNNNITHCSLQGRSNMKDTPIYISPTPQLHDVLKTSAPGDIIVLRPGIYKGPIRIDCPGLTLRAGLGCELYNKELETDQIQNLHNVQYENNKEKGGGRLLSKYHSSQNCEDKERNEGGGSGIYSGEMPRYTCTSNKIVSTFFPSSGTNRMLNRRRGNPNGIVLTSSQRRLISTKRQEEVNMNLGKSPDDILYTPTDIIQCGDDDVIIECFRGNSNGNCIITSASSFEPCTSTVYLSHSSLPHCPDLPCVFIAAQGVKIQGISFIQHNPQGSCAFIDLTGVTNSSSRKTSVLSSYSSSSEVSPLTLSCCNFYAVNRCGVEVVVPNSSMGVIAEEVGTCLPTGQYSTIHNNNTRKPTQQDKNKNNENIKKEEKDSQHNIKPLSGTALPLSAAVSSAVYCIKIDDCYITSAASHGVAVISKGHSTRVPSPTSLNDRGKHDQHHTTLSSSSSLLLKSPCDNTQHSSNITHKLNYNNNNNNNNFQYNQQDAQMMISIDITSCVIMNCGKSGIFLGGASTQSNLSKGNTIVNISHTFIDNCREHGVFLKDLTKDIVGTVGPHSMDTRSSFDLNTITKLTMLQRQQDKERNILKDTSALHTSLLMGDNTSSLYITKTIINKSIINKQIINKPIELIHLKSLSNITITRCDHYGSGGLVVGADRSVGNICPIIEDFNDNLNNNLNNINNTSAGVHIVFRAKTGGTGVYIDPMGVIIRGGEYIVCEELRDTPCV